MDYRIIDRCDNFYDVEDTSSGRKVNHDRLAMRPNHEQCMLMVSKDRATQVDEYLADDIAKTTFDAYSRHKYSEQDWYACTVELLTRGLTRDQTEVFLYSKHMRWVSDSAAPAQPNIHHFRKYLDREDQYGFRKNAEGRTLVAECDMMMEQQR